MPRRVFHLDLDGADYTEGGAPESKLDEALRDWEEVWGSAYGRWTLANRLVRPIEPARREKGRRAVVLVDEYDDPLLDALGDDALLKRDRGVLKGVYGVVKKADEHPETVFVTGATRFSRVDISSDANNLNDLSLAGEPAGICGITESEICRFLAPEAARLAERRNVDFECAPKELRERYDGYCFHPERPEGEVFADESRVMNYRAENPDQVALLFQAGHLTIRGYDEDCGEYALGVSPR